MRFFHIVPERPAASGSGAQLRAHALNRALSGQGDVVTVTVAEAFAAAGLRPRRTRSFIEAEVPQAVLSAIRAQARAGPGDVAIVEGVYLAAVARDLAAGGARVILDAHNVESDLLRQSDLARHPFLARLQRGGRWQRAAEAERRLLETVTAVWACSAADTIRLHDLFPNTAPIHVVPNPVPDWCLSSTQQPRKDGIEALFVGHLGYRPNIVAALRLCERIFPALRASDPSACLILAGRAPGAAMGRTLKRARGVTLVADPVDLTPLYASATMTLMPLSEGGGTRIKALEAMAQGLPIIGSRKAVEGLMLTPGREYLSAESDSEFVDAALRLARTPQLRAELAASGREFALRWHGPHAIEAAVTAALGEMGINP